MALSFITNIALIVTFLFALNILLHRIRRFRSIIVGTALGGLGLLLMLDTIYIPNSNAVVDYRQIAAMIGAIYFGPAVAVIATTIIALGRLLMFDLTSASYVATFFLTLIGGVSAWIALRPWSNLTKMRFLSFFSLAAVFVSLSINTGDMGLVMQIYGFYFPLGLLGSYLAYRVAEHIQLSEHILRHLSFTTSQLQALITSLQSGVLVENEKREVLLVNDAFCHMLNDKCTPQQLIGRHADDVTHFLLEQAVERNEMSARLNELIAQKRLVVNELVTLQGDRTFERDFIPIYVDGRYSGHFWNYRDLTAAKRVEHQMMELNHKLTVQSRLDGLTNIPNRRTFDEMIELMIEGDLTLILFDIDHFKAYNDTYGHIQGDQCLRTIATIIEQAASKHQYFYARYGGEEFAVLVPHVERDAVEQFTNQLQDYIAHEQIENRNSSVLPWLTISIGISMKHVGETMRAEQLIFHADEALYAAKRQGRNRYVFADETVPTRR